METGQYPGPHEDEACSAQTATDREELARLARRRPMMTAAARTMPAIPSVKSATCVRTITFFSVGATAASNANSTNSAAAARTLSRRQNHNVEPRNMAAKAAAAAGTSIQKMSTVSQGAKARPARMGGIRV